jgi:hypothetical protein
MEVFKGFYLDSVDGLQHTVLQQGLLVGRLPELLELLHNLPGVHGCSSR